MHSAVVANTQATLNGSASGSMSGMLGSTTDTATLSGSATFGSLGGFTLSGSLSSSTVATGKGNGTIVLTGSQGTLTLQLTRTYPPHATSATLPYTFKIVSGTGAYAGYQGSGTATLTQTPTPAGSVHTAGARFSLSFSSV